MPYRNKNRAVELGSSNGLVVMTDERDMSHPERMLQKNILYLGGIVNAMGWVDLEGNFSDEPASIGRITMTTDLTSVLAPGLPVRFVLSSGAANPGAYYAIISAVTATYIDILGPPLETDPGDLESLEVGPPEWVRHYNFFIAGTYGDGVGDLLGPDMTQYFYWPLAPAYLVSMAAKHGTDDIGTEPFLNVKIGSSLVSTLNGGDGFNASSVGFSWNGAGAIDPATYRIEFPNDLEIRCTVAGGTGNAADLTLTTVFVLEG